MGDVNFDAGPANPSYTPVYRTVGERISFTSLLLRLPFQSFYRIPVFAGLRSQPDFHNCFPLHAKKWPRYTVGDHGGLCGVVGI
jgi:hypothetical protein